MKVYTIEEIKEESEKVIKQIDLVIGQLEEAKQHLMDGDYEYNDCVGVYPSNIAWLNSLMSDIQLSYKALNEHE